MNHPAFTKVCQKLDIPWKKDKKNHSNQRCMCVHVMPALAKKASISKSAVDQLFFCWWRNYNSSVICLIYVTTNVLFYNYLLTDQMLYRYVNFDCQRPLEQTDIHWQGIVSEMTRCPDLIRDPVHALLVM